MANKVVVSIGGTQTVSKAAKEAEGGLKSLTAATKELKKDAQAVTAPITNLRNTLTLIAGSAGAAVLAITRTARAAIELGTAAAKTEQTSRAFQELARSVGASADDIVTRLRAVSRGTVSEMDLIASASKAALYDLPLEDLDKLMTIARASAMATGESVSKMFDDIVVGIARGSPMILDNLGITIKLEEAYQAYAAQLGKTAEALTGAEKKQALLHATIAAGQETVDRMGDSLREMTSLESIDAARAAWEEFRNELGERLRPVVATLADAFASLMGGITASLEAARVLGLRERTLQGAKGLMLQWIPGDTLEMLAAQLELGEALKLQWADEMARLKSGSAELNELTSQYVALDAFLVTVAQRYYDIEEAAKAAKKAQEPPKVTAAVDAVYQYDPTAYVPEYYRYPNFDRVTNPGYSSPLAYFGQVFDEAEGDVYALGEQVEKTTKFFGWLTEELTAFNSEAEWAQVGGGFQQAYGPAAGGLQLTEYGSPEEMAGAQAGAMLGNIDGLNDAFAEMLLSVKSIQLLADPISTMLQATLEVIGPLIDTALAPLVGVFVVLGQLIGTLLVPVIQMLTPVIDAVAKGFVWLYNSIIRPVGQIIYGIFVGLGSMLATIVNAVIDAINTFRRRDRQIEHWEYSPGSAEEALPEISYAGLLAAGGEAISGGGSNTYTSGSQTTVEHQPDIYVTINIDGSVYGAGGPKEVGKEMARALEEFAGIGGRIRILGALT